MKAWFSLALSGLNVHSAALDVTVAESAALVGRSPTGAEAQQLVVSAEQACEVAVHILPTGTVEPRQYSSKR